MYILGLLPVFLSHKTPTPYQNQPAKEPMQPWPEGTWIFRMHVTGAKFK